MSTVFLGLCGMCVYVFVRSFRKWRKRAREKREQLATNTTFNRVKIPGLYRNLDDRWLGGVCSGFAHKLNITAGGMRVLFMIFAVMSAGTALIIYPLLWILFQGYPIKRMEAPRPAETAATHSEAHRHEEVHGTSWGLIFAVIICILLMMAA